MKDLVTSDDYKFGLKIIKEYPKISLNDLYVLIYCIRRSFEQAVINIEELKVINQTDSSELKEKLSSGTIIKNIIINTDKGPLIIYNYGDVYANLTLTAKKAITKQKENSEKINKAILKDFNIDIPFKLIMTTIFKTPLGPDRKRIIIGMFVDYFRIFNIMSEQEFKKSSHIGTWKRYLSDWVKSKLKSFSI